MSGVLGLPGNLGNSERKELGSLKPPVLGFSARPSRHRKLGVQAGLMMIDRNGMKQENW